jgi:hypothetical protein
MKVTVNNIEFKVYWKHDNLSALKEKYNGFTYCTIQKIGDMNTNEYFGTSKCVSKDNFNKSKGRIVSLTKAISKGNKAFRTAFWKAYAEQIGFK